MDLQRILKRILSGAVGVLGIPVDDNASFMKGASQGPESIRNALYTGSSNLCSENGLDLSSCNRFQDMGDLHPGSGPAAMDRISEAVAKLLEKDIRILTLGGDHSITYPVFKTFDHRYGPLALLQFDAHPDLYHEYEGNPYSHACPFARIMESCPQTRLIQVGVRSITPHQRTQANRFGTELIEMRNLQTPAALNLKGPIYISLDLDALDPAYAPGVSHPEPGGLTTRDILQFIQAVDGPVVGADIVELNPSLDPSGVTAMTAAKFLKELAGKMIDI
jgi:agmatinase